MGIDPREQATRKSVDGDPPRPAELEVTGRTRGPHELEVRDLPPRIGRYAIEARLGEGGMGVVYRARDGELDRSLAIKLLHARRALRDAGVRARFQREAQAMAQLSHPNVVQIYDVGEHDGQLFVAMELIRGRNLREWLRPSADHRGRVRPWRAVLDVFVQAGHGLAAAHAAGIVHRDFKPENVFVGDDGRVRVGDFGLAQRTHEADPPPEADETSVDGRIHASASGALTEPGTLLGTPAYMSPEQLRREPTDARTDQFSFCVALWEGLYGERPFEGKTLADVSLRVLTGRLRPPPPNVAVPGWLRRAVERGLSARPGERHASMLALLAALSRGQARARTRLVAAALTLAVGTSAGAYAWHRADLASRTAACAADGAAIDEVWNDAARERVRAALLATGATYAASTAERVIPWLDRRAEAWRTSREETCLDAHVRKTSDRDTDERARWCLEERTIELRGLVELLAAADPKIAQHAVPTAAALPSAERCRDRRHLARLPLPPAEGRGEVETIESAVLRSNLARSVGKLDEALDLARGTLVRAEALAWPPLVAAARRNVGAALDARGKYAEAEPVLEDAYFEAVGAGATELAADIATDMITLVGSRLARPGEGRRWARHAEAAIAEHGPGEGLLTADRLGGLASLAQNAGAYAEARALTERALAIRERELGAEHPRVIATLNDIARGYIAEGKLAEARELFARVLTITEKNLGADHPNTASYLHNLGGVNYELGEYRQAREIFERALRLRERLYDRDHPSIAATLGNLAGVQYTLALYAESRASFERALAIREKALGPEHPETLGTLVNFANVLRLVGEQPRSREMLERVLAIREKTLGPEHPSTAHTVQLLAADHFWVGDYAGARTLYARAVALREKVLAPDHPDLALSLAGLGKTLVAAGAHAEARPLLARALALQEKIHGPDHAETPEFLDPIGKLHLVAGELSAARAHHERALAIGERAFGRDHPDLSLSLEGLAAVALAEGRHADAIALADRALRRTEVPPRVLADLRFTLAQALWDAPEPARDRERARVLAGQARDAYRVTASLDAQRAAVDEWLAQRR